MAGLTLALTAAYALAPGFRELLGITLIALVVLGVPVLAIAVIVLALLMPDIGVWAMERMKSRREAGLARNGLCTACGYDLTGITGPCPECGKERERGA